ncbi:uncharacterized protein LOC116029546 [Ipomoea triloba]|uniref:uncharacterized protein LOC116029546 n=1 Tax=Ipomoea triloba TaxID=35885 RepID=UPI00125CE239|nr:uncharacterized protein LOC116029546 [Ipomoea triloba]
MASDLPFEFDESDDCWVRSGGDGVAVKSLPMKIPDWRRILGMVYQQVERAPQDSDYNAAWSVEEDEDEYFGLPPHVYLARTRGESRWGRSVKGRDLCRLRNAIWKRIGFED